MLSQWLVMRQPGLLPEKERLFISYIQAVFTWQCSTPRVLMSVYWDPSILVFQNFAVIAVPGGGGTPKKMGRGVLPASQNHYPVYDQNLRFSLPNLWPIYDLIKKLIPYLWADILLVTKMAAKSGQNRYSIYNQNGWKTIPFVAAHTYITHIGVTPGRRLLLEILAKF